MSSARRLSPPAATDCAVDFDAVVIDEAGQVTLPLAVMAMLLADTYVLVGDHRQLPPVIQSLPRRETHLASVFCACAGTGVKRCSMSLTE